MSNYLWKDMSLGNIDSSNQKPYEYTHQFANGQTRTLWVLDEEVPYPDGRMIVSRTDLNGVITHANQAFIDISAYEKEELIGSPQCILRHPDIPRSVFEQMWQTIQSGQSWFGYVKNLRKDGRYYWVYASVNPNFRDGKIVAYTSVRRKPARSKIMEMEAFIQQYKKAS